jgi:uncharacterized protein (DUF952 family)
MELESAKLFFPFNFAKYQMPAPRFIYHIVTSAELQSQDKDVFISAQLENEGFIHCSKLEQLNGTIRRFYKAKKDLRILKIDTSLLNVPLIYEAAGDGSGFFPHVFGAISRLAITEILEPPFKFP